MKNNEWRKKCWSMFVFQRLRPKCSLRVDPQIMITIVTDTGCCLFFATFLSLLNVDPVLLGGD